MAGALAIFITIVIISAVVGAIAQFLNKVTEQQNQARRAAADRGGRGLDRGDRGGGQVRQNPNDIDRFLAEIDRLRRKSADAPGDRPAPAVPVARPVRPQGGQRPRAAEPVEVRRAEPAPTFVVTAPADPGESLLTPVPPPKPVEFQLPPPVAPVKGAELAPVVTALPPVSSAPVVPLTPRAIANRRSKAAPTNAFGRDLAGLLGSGNGVALAVVLKEVFGPPKSRGG